MYDDDDYTRSQISPLTDGQERILSLLNVISASLSILGSSTIVYKVVKNWNMTQQAQQRQQSQQHRTIITPYDRIMLGLSLTDIVASIAYALSPFLVPSETSQRVWAMGNTATCSMLGWLTQSAFAAIWYNALLSFYYLLTVRFRISRDQFATKYEKWFHASVIVYFGTTATVGSVAGWYSEFQLNQGCWIGEIPQGCEAAGTCTGTGQLVGWFFGGLPMLMTYLALIVNNIVIYIYVRNTLRPSRLDRNVATANNMEHDPSNNRSIKGSSKFSVDDSMRSLSSSVRFSNTTAAATTTTMTSSTLEDLSNRALQEERRLRQKAQIREVASQGFLYVGTFLLSYTPAFVVRVIDGIGFGASDEERLYPLLILNAFLLPLQGFFNMFVHTRPSYHRFRAAYPELPWWWSLRQACFDSDIPKYSDAQFSSTWGGVRSSSRPGGGSDSGSAGGVAGRRSQNGDGMSSQQAVVNAIQARLGRSRKSAFSSDLDPVEEDSQEDDTSGAMIMIDESQGITTKWTYLRGTGPTTPNASMEKVTNNMTFEDVKVPFDQNGINKIGGEHGPESPPKTELRSSDTKSPPRQAPCDTKRKDANTISDVASSSEEEEDSMEMDVRESNKVFQQISRSARRLHMDGGIYQ